MDVHVCDYLGEIGNHLCYNDARPVEQAGHSAGAIRFFDQTYTQVGPDYGPEGDLRAPDIHELNTPSGTRGETFIQDIYEIKRMDLRDYNGPEQGYVLDGCFQEVDLRTKSVIFQWCALDWMPVYDTYMYLHAVNSPNYSLPIAGNGQMIAPWDFFHINAIARNDEGDYAVSGRHLNTVFKIAGKNNRQGREPGSIMWRLGGRNNDFQMDFNFSRQHTARFHSTGHKESVLSLFDNAFDGWMTTSKWSSGKMIKINNETMEASLIAQYDDPDQQLAFSQGSLQTLHNGNVFISWGNHHSFSEFTYDGNLLYHATFTGDIETFRAWKHPWKGYPTYPPRVRAYARNCTAPLYAYASWNGATEVRSYRFYSSWGTHLGPWHETGVFKKNGFETFANLSTTASPSYETYAPYVYIEALDHYGQVLDKSNVVHTFVPRNATVARKFHCNETMCGKRYFRFEESWSCGASCPRTHVVAMYVIVLGICLVELLNWVFIQGLDWKVSFGAVGWSDKPRDREYGFYEKHDFAREKSDYTDGYQSKYHTPSHARTISKAEAGFPTHNAHNRPRAISLTGGVTQRPDGHLRNPSHSTTGTLSRGFSNLLMLFGAAPSHTPVPSPVFRSPVPESKEFEKGMLADGAGTDGTGIGTGGTSPITYAARATNGTVEEQASAGMTTSASVSPVSLASNSNSSQTVAGGQSHEHRRTSSGVLAQMQRQQECKPGRSHSGRERDKDRDRDRDGAG